MYRGVPSSRLFISSSVAEICSVKVQSRSQKAVLPHPAGGKCPGEFGPNFSNNSHKWICIQVWSRSVQRSPRLGIKNKRKEKKEETTAVKYKPFGSAMPCGLITFVGSFNIRKHSRIFANLNIRNIRILVLRVKTYDRKRRSVCCYWRQSEESVLSVIIAAWRQLSASSRPTNTSLSTMDSERRGRSDRQSRLSSALSAAVGPHEPARRPPSTDKPWSRSAFCTSSCDFS